MELKKLAIALLALYIVYCFMSKENYAFDETGLQFPADAGYIDIYHKNNKGNYELNKVEFSKNISSENKADITVAGNSFTIKEFTSKVPKSVLLYTVNYDENKNVDFYRLMENIDNNAIQVEMKPGQIIKFANLSTVALALKFPKETTTTTKDAKGKVITTTTKGFKDGDIIHTGRFVFTF